MKKKIAMLLALALMLTACQQSIPVTTNPEIGHPTDPPKTLAGDMMEDIAPNFVKTVAVEGASQERMAFALRLFQNANSEKNTLISPLSVLIALSMTANGAQGETLSQMEAVLGDDMDTLNNWLYSYMHSFPEEGSKLALANSIWFRDDERLTVERDFLQTNADYFGAAIRKVPFDDSTVREINGWVKENTEGMIDGILQEIPDDVVMYLVNALAFQAKWQEPYENYQIREGQFNILDPDGTTRSVEFMYSEESIYLSDERATGFIKYYQGYDYAFVALLPNGDVDLQGYIQSLTAEHLKDMLKNPQYITVHAGIPKYEVEFECEMGDILRKMGMELAFDPDHADFSKMGSSTNGKLCISRVLHKTYISVNEEGTKAAAVTSVEMTDAACAPVEEYKTVTLDRPFLYLIIDTHTDTPIFMGTVNDIGR